MKAFLSLVTGAGICTAAELSVPQHVNILTDPVFNTTVRQLHTHSNARFLSLATNHPVVQCLQGHCVFL